MPEAFDEIYRPRFHSSLLLSSLLEQSVTEEHNLPPGDHGSEIEWERRGSLAGIALRSGGWRSSEMHKARGYRRSPVVLSEMVIREGWIELSAPSRSRPSCMARWRCRLGPTPDSRPHIRRDVARKDCPEGTWGWIVPPA